MESFHGGAPLGGAFSCPPPREQLTNEGLCVDREGPASPAAAALFFSAGITGEAEWTDCRRSFSGAGFPGRCDAALVSDFLSVC